MQKSSRIKKPVTSVLLGLACAGLAPFGNQASAAAFTAEQRQEIISIVRTALKDDPSILKEAVLSIQQKNHNQQKNSLKDNLAYLTAGPLDIVRGNPKGDVTIVEIYDPRCPYCHKVIPVIEQVVKEDRDIKIVEKIVPILGPDSVRAARAITAATQQGQTRAQQFQTLLMSGQAVSEEQMYALAQKSGLDIERLKKDMADARISSTLESNIALMTRLGIEGTPAFIVNGQTVIPGAVSTGSLQHIVKKARASR